MKLKYALCGCNSRESTELFKKQFLTFFGYAYIFFMILEVCIIIATCIIMKPFSISPKIYLNETFYQTCFKDSEFTAASHRELHEKCIQLQNITIWINPIPKDVIPYKSVMNEVYDKLKGYLDDQQKHFNLTECFTELQENYLNDFESRATNGQIIFGSAIITTVLFATVTIMRCSKINDDDVTGPEGLGCSIFGTMPFMLSCLSFYYLKYNLNILKDNSMDYFVEMC